MNPHQVLPPADLEPEAQSFVIKLWLDTNQDKYPRKRWRGHISHVPSSERRNLKNLAQISDFIAEHLDSQGADLGWWWWLKHDLHLF